MMFKPDLKALSVCFAAGSFGGLSNSLFNWLCGTSGINAALGIALKPAFTPEWLYVRLVWGGLWGLLFCLPLLKNKSIYIRASILFLLPLLVQLFIVFPFKLNKGYMGVDLGTLTPVLVILANLVWAYTTAYWIKMSQVKI